MDMDFAKILERRNKLVDVICSAYDKATPRLASSVYARGPYQPIKHADGSFTTFCNCFVNDIAVGLGCNDFWDTKNKRAMLANEMFNFLGKAKDWAEVEMKKAQSLANSGYLVVCAQKNSGGHGHVCVVRPGEEKPSGRWCSVPAVANVGRECNIGKGLNWAFSELPKFYLWRAGI